MKNVENYVNCPKTVAGIGDFCYIYTNHCHGQWV